MKFRHGFKWGVLAATLALGLVVGLGAQGSLGGIPTSIGSAVDFDTAFKLAGTFTPNASPGFGSSNELTIRAQEASQELAAHNIAPTLAEYVSGAAPDYFTSLRVMAPTITAGAATNPTVASAIYLGAAGTGATSNYSLFGATSATAYFTTADSVQVGGIIVPQEIEVSYHCQAAATCVDASFFVATQAYQVTRVSFVGATAEATAGTQVVQVVKDTSTNAPGAGTDLLTNTSSTGFNVKSTANTVQVGTLTATGASLQMAAGDRLSVDYTTTNTEGAGVTITVTLKRI